MKKGDHTAKHLTQLYHDNKNSDKDSNKVCEKGHSMLHIVQIIMVCLLNDILSVHYHVTQEHQEPKIQLHILHKVK